jgi:hypothetical protein
MSGGGRQVYGKPLPIAKTWEKPQHLTFHGYGTMYGSSRERLFIVRRPGEGY